MASNYERDIVILITNSETVRFSEFSGDDTDKEFLDFEVPPAKKVNETRSLRTKLDRIFADGNIENTASQKRFAPYSGHRIHLADEASELVSF